MALKLWTSILNEWIKKTKLADVDDDSLPHFNLGSFYEELKKTDSELEISLQSFLTARFPGIEIIYDETRHISTQDHVSICALILYYSCAIRPNGFLQKCCSELETKHQEIVFKFLKKLKETQDNKAVITKEVLNAAFHEAIPYQTPNIKFISSSPIRTPDKVPPTPNRSFERAKELQKVKTLLNNERYERNLLDVEMKQTEDKLQSLLKEQKQMKQELHKFRTEQAIERNQENLSPNKVIRDEQIRSKMQKEIDSRDEIIVNLRCEIEALTAKNEKSNSHNKLRDKEMLSLRETVSELSTSNDTLREDYEMICLKIKSLEDENNELQSILSANCSNKKDQSSDLMDFSFSSGENLAKSVVEFQLKEKETENNELNEKLQKMSDEKLELQAIVDSKTEAIEALQKELDQEKKSSQQLSQQIKALTAKLEATVSDFQRKMKADLQEITEQNLQLKDLNTANLTGLQKQHEEETKKIVQSHETEMQKLLKDYENKFSNLVDREQVIKLERQMENAKITFELNDKAHAETLAALQQDLVEERDSKQQLVKSLTAQSSKVETLKAENTSMKAELQTSQEKVECIKSESEEKQKNIKKLLESQTAKLTDLQKQHKEEMKKVALSHENEIQKLRQEYENKVSTLIDREQAINLEKQLKNVSAALQKALFEERDSKQQIVESLSAISSQVETFRNENTSMKAELQSSQEKIESIMSESEEKQKEFKQLLENEIAKLTDLQKQHEEETKKMVQSHETEKEKLREECENKVSNLVETLATLKKDLVNEQDAKQELAKSLTAISSQIETFRNENTSMKAELQTSQEKIKSIMSESEEKQKEFQQLLENETAKLTDLQMKHEEETKKMVQSHETEKEKLFVEYENKVSNLVDREQVIKLEKQLENASALTETLADLKKDLVNEQGSKQELAESLTAMSSTVVNLRTEITSTKAELQTSQEKIESIKLESKEKQTEIKQLLDNEMAKLTGLQRQHEEEMKKVALSHETELQNLRQDYESKLSNLVDREQVINLEKQLHNVHAETLSALQKDLVEERDSKQELVKSLTAISSKVETLRTENTSMKAELQTSQEKIESIKSESEEKQKDIKQLLENEMAKLTDLQKQHEEEMKKVVQSHETETQNLQQEYETKVSNLVDREQVINLEKQLHNVHAETLSALQKDLVEERDSKQELVKSLTAISSKVETLITENTSMKAELQTSQVKIESIKSESEEKQKDIKQLLESEMAKLTDLQTQHEEEMKKVALSHETEIQNLQQEYETKISNLVDREQVINLEKQLETAKKFSSNENSRITGLLQKLQKVESVDEDMKDLAAKHEQEKVSHQKSIEIFNAKLMKERDSKDQLDTKLQAMEKALEDAERKHQDDLKTQRGELEGKLEKMKGKMKEIYNEEMKKKSHAIQQQETKLHQLHQHVKQLEESNSRMNKDNLCLKRENDFMTSKLRFLGEIPARDSIGMSRPSTTTQMNGANFGGMEDEPGEEFNNMYLQELQTGCGSQISLDQMNLYNAEELQKRNSLYPQHMRSSYAIAGVDKMLSEQEMKDGSIFDNSQTALLPNKKKQSVSYNRPGPPTPGKTGTRLSIGPTSILKDSTNQENLGKKTPSRMRLSFFGKNKDELRNNRERTLTPSRIRSVRGDEENGKSPLLQRKENKRKDERDQVRDSNRPNLNQQPSTESNSGDDWTDEDDEFPETRNQLNESMHNVKQVERFNEKMKSKRLRSFKENRRKSSESVAEFHSCMSLKSEANSSQTNLSSPNKACTRNFIDSHHIDVNRMSDYYIPKKEFPEPETELLDNKSQNNQQPQWYKANLIKALIIGVTIAMFAMIYPKKT